MEKTLFASCKCGDVKFESEERPVIQLCCHCTDCRSALAADFATISFFNVVATKVSGNVSEYKFMTAEGNTTVREYCSRCEDVMFDKSSGFPTLIGVMSSQIKPPFKSAPVGHIWVDSKLTHVEIPEGAKQYAKGFYSS